MRLQACRNKKNVPKVKQQSTAITNEIHTNNKAVVLAKTTAFSLVYWGGVMHVPIRTIGGVISGVCTIFGIISSIISGIIGRIGTIFYFFFLRHFLLQYFLMPKLPRQTTVLRLRNSIKSECFSTIFGNHVYHSIVYRTHIKRRSFSTVVVLIF